MTAVTPDGLCSGYVPTHGAASERPQHPARGPLSRDSRRRHPRRTPGRRGSSRRDDPLALAAATLYLPTRRSIRAIREVFLDRLGQEAAILPRLLPLGEIDEDEAAFDLAAPICSCRTPSARSTRQIGLTRLILAWSRTMRGALLPMAGEDEPLLIPSSPGDAAGARGGSRPFHRRHADRRRALRGAERAHGRACRAAMIATGT